MYYGEIKKCDIANGTGVRVSLFVSGCRNCCPGCFNKETWDFQYGNPYTPETEQEILDLLKPDYIEGFSLLGGEPSSRKTRQCWKVFSNGSKNYIQRKMYGVIPDINMTRI